MEKSRLTTAIYTGLFISAFSTFTYLKFSPQNTPTKAEIIVTRSDKQSAWKKPVSDADSNRAGNSSSKNNIPHQLDSIKKIHSIASEINYSATQYTHEKSSTKNINQRMTKQRRNIDFTMGKMTVNNVVDTQTVIATEINFPHTSATIHDNSHTNTVATRRTLLGASIQPNSNNNEDRFLPDGRSQQDLFQAQQRKNLHIYSIKDYQQEKITCNKGARKLSSNAALIYQLKGC